MLKNYFKTAFRSLLRNRLNTAINLLGLASGITACILMVLYVQDEKSYDHYHQKADQIYRITNELDLSGRKDHVSPIGFRVGPTLVDEYPEVEAYVRFVSAGARTTVRYEDRLFNENEFYMVDTTVFAIFDWQLLQGDPVKSLSRPRTTVLSKSLADKYFGEQDPLGKQIRFNSNDYEITGIMADVPEHSDFRPKALLSMNSIPQGAMDAWNGDWLRMVCNTYLLFNQDIDQAVFEEKLVAFADENVHAWLEQFGVDGHLTYHLQSLKGLHFVTNISYDNPKGSLAYLYIFSIVAGFILLIACINYINLSIAQSTGRGTEVGIRKVTGASQLQLIGQFIGESMILAFLALGISIIFLEVSLPVFNNLADKSFELLDVFQPTQVLTMILLVAFIGLVAGSYPAFFLARQKPIRVLKGELSLSSKQWLRKFLVVVQFTISIALITSTLIVYNQLSFLQSQDLGFQKDQIMVLNIPNDTTVSRKADQLRNELLAYSGITKVAGGNPSSIPGQSPGGLLFRFEFENRLIEKVANFIRVDENYIDVLDLQLVSGRNFERSRSTDPDQAFIVNEALVKLQGWEEPLGKRVQWGLNANDSAAYDGKVVGVIKDFHFTSLHNEIEPLVLIFHDQAPNRIFIEMEGGDQLGDAINFVQNKWPSFDPNHPIEYRFLDETFEAQYRKETKMMAIFGYFTALTILIACMGLFGLSAFITRQRTKEIGIRKVVGAGIGNIVVLLSKDFALLVLLSLMMAIPVAWYGMGQWLGDFAYRITLGPAVFLMAGCGALFIALLTTSFHAIRAARTNPVEALRYE